VRRSRLTCGVTRSGTLNLSILRRIGLRIVGNQGAVLIDRLNPSRRCRGPGGVLHESPPLAAFPLGHERSAPSQFVGAEARAGPLDRLGGGVKCFTAPDAGQRRALGACRRAQSVQRMETDRVPIRPEVLCKLCAR
jgi:hypothetical protein